MSTLPEPLFVGRQQEAERIRGELRAGRNLVLTGRFGIGRTALLRHLAREMKTECRFIFLDGSLTAARLCEQLHLALFPGVPCREPGARQLWKTLRNRIGRSPVRERQALVLVLDDLGRLTRQRLDFLRWLSGLDRFRIIAVAELFLPEEDLIHLRTALHSAPLVPLEPLSPGKARLFFESWARHQGLAWGYEEVHGLVLATHGYPLGMAEAVKTLCPGAGPVRP